jgi:hypothetical protein
LWALDKGFKVFPLIENGKIPALDAWQHWAENSSIDKVEEFAAARPNCNWGLYCGASGLTVIDVDTKEGKVGLESLKEVQAGNSVLPRTTVASTPTGGYHIYYKGQCPSSVSALAKDIDTRGEGGYVVLPYSKINGKAYEIAQADPIVPLPIWVLTTVKKNKKEKKNLSDGEMIETGERNNFLASFAGTMRERGASQQVILDALLTMNATQLSEPLPEHDVKTIAHSISRYEPEHAKVASEFAKPVKVMAITGDKVDFSALKPRDWVMKDRYVGGIVSALIAPGGAGKSTVSLLDALAVCTGRPLSGFPVKKKGNVWLYNTEDPLGELELRLAAMCTAHSVTQEERAGLHLTSGRDVPLVLAKKGKNGITVNEEAIKSAIDYIREQEIVLMIVDPFVRSHEVDENDNMQIDKVIWCFQKIMDATGCAICVVHHTNKGVYNVTSPEEKMHTGRGASALVYATRITHVLTPMKEEEARNFGVPEARRRWYVRLDNAKANLQAPAEKAHWYEKIGVDLLIGEQVGAIRPSDIATRAAKIEADEEARRRVDVAQGLATCGKAFPMSLSDAYKALKEHPTMGQLFAKRKHVKSGVRFLADLLGNAPVTHGEFKFSYVRRDDLKVKQWVVAERII